MQPLWLEQFHGFVFSRCMSCHAMHVVEQHQIMGNKPWLLPSNSDQFQAPGCILGNQYIKTCQR